MDKTIPFLSLIGVFAIAALVLGGINYDQIKTIETPTVKSHTHPTLTETQVNAIKLLIDQKINAYNDTASTTYFADKQSTADTFYNFALELEKKEDLPVQISNPELFGNQGHIEIGDATGPDTGFSTKDLEDKTTEEDYTKDVFRILDTNGISFKHGDDFLGIKGWKQNFEQLYVTTNDGDPIKVGQNNKPTFIATPMLPPKMKIGDTMTITIEQGDVKQIITWEMPPRP